MLPKITITIEGPSCEGIGKTTVAQIIERALKQYNYEVAYSVVPCADNPVPLTTESFRQLMEAHKRLVAYDIEHAFAQLQPQDSRPRATINLVEHV